MTEKTNDYLHLKSKVLKARYRDPHVPKDLDRRAWVDPPEKVGMNVLAPSQNNSLELIRTDNKASTQGFSRSKFKSQSHAHSKDTFDAADQSNSMDPVARGTLFNHFYKPNPETAPMLSLPNNLDSQVQSLEKLHKRKIDDFAQIVDKRVQHRHDTVDQRLMAERSIRH